MDDETAASLVYISLTLCVRARVFYILLRDIRLGGM